MKKTALLLAALMVTFHLPAYAFREVAAVKVPGARFYSIKAVENPSGGPVYLFAAGQIRVDRVENGLIVAYSMDRDGLKELAREHFHMGDRGKTRIRSLICMDAPPGNGLLIIVNGKAGPENREKGFIRSYLFRDKGLKPVDNVEFSNPETSYTHGYPLIQADLDGDCRNEVIYGGFSGDDDRDRADIRFFSVGSDGRFSPFTGPQQDRLSSLRLRINAMTSGDLDGDGISEVVAAGRTVEKDLERAAFTAFSAKALTWKQVDNLGSCRYRYALAADMTGEGRPELVLGGRNDQGGISSALLDIWQARSGDLHLISRYRFTGIGSTRLRVVEPMNGVPGNLVIGGRMEVLQNGRLRWKGFIQELKFSSGMLLPRGEPVVLDKDWETRIRATDIHEDSLIAAGFTEDRNKASTAFIKRFIIE